MRLVELGDVHFTADNLASAAEYYERARSRLELLGAAESDRVLIELKLSDCHRRRGRFVEAAALVRAAVERVRGTADGLLPARLLARLGEIENQLGEYASAQLHCLKAYEVLRGTSANEEIGNLELTLGTISSRLGQTTRARDHFESALFTFRRIDQREGIAKALNNLGVLLKNGPRWAEAREYLLRALSVSEEAGNYARVSGHALNLGILFTKTAEWAQAQQSLNRSLSICKETGNSSGETRAHLALGNLKLRLRQFRVAETHYVHALELARQHSYAREEVLALEFLGELALRRGEFKPASEKLDEAYALARRVAPEGDLVSELRRRQAEVALACGDLETATVLASEAVQVASQIGDQIEAGAALRVWAESAAESGRLDSARTLLERSLVLLKSTPDVLERLRTEWMQARLELLSATTSANGGASAESAAEAVRIGGRLWPRFLELLLPELAVEVLLDVSSAEAALGELDEALSGVHHACELVEQHALPGWTARLEQIRTDLEERFAESTLSRSAEYQLLQEMAGIAPLDPEASLRECAKLLRERSRSDRALLILWSDSSPARVAVNLGFDARDLSESERFLSGLEQDFAQGRRIHVVHRPMSEHQVAPSVAAGRPAVAAVAIPLPMTEERRALLYVDRLEGTGAGPYRHSDLRLLSLFGGWLSMLVGVQARTQAPTPGRRDADLDAYSSYVTCNSELRRAFTLLRKVDASDVSILITGETGTGKGFLSRLVHEASARRGQPFVPVNCAALPETLLESELFGHLQGAFTGAVRNKRGLFEEAAGGTIFLDEIDKAPLGVQAKLLHVLDQHEIRPVGGTKWHPVDVRVVCATNVDLRRAIQDGRVLEDLYYRLNDFQVHLPPLRERREDIPLLIRHFYQQFCRELGRSPLGLSRGVVQALTEHEWRGNVRELEKVVKRILVLAEDAELIGPELLPREIVERVARETERPTGTLRAEIQRLEARMIRDALSSSGGNKSEAARRLRLSYPSLLSKIKQYELESRSDRA